MFSSENLHFSLPDKTLALTYDDGPGPRTVEIATFLRDRGIRATFFVVGKYVRADRESVRIVKELGHLIGNHTDTHPNLKELTSKPDELIRQVVEVDREIQEFVGKGPFLLRPPFGEWLPEVTAVLKRSDDLKKYFGPVNWTIDHGDWQIGSPRNEEIYTLERCQNDYLQDIRGKRSGVVLLHDWSADAGEYGERLRSNNRTPELTKWLIPQLDDFKFVGLDEIGIPAQRP